MSELLFSRAHCDSKVCHEPGLCEYCDRYPEVQQSRIDCGVNFTGNADPDLLPDPATQSRPLDRMYAWRGNMPQGPNVPQELKDVMDSIESPSSQIMYGDWSDDGII